MKRDYPLFLIDRSKLSTYPFDYISCFDREVGFVARIVIFKEDKLFNEFILQQSNISDAEIGSYATRLKMGGVILVVEDFLYHFEITGAIKERIKTLMKKAMKKYLFATYERETDGTDFNIENQIKMQELTIERAKSTFDALIKRSSEEEAKYNIALAESILDTLKMVQDNQKYLKTILN